MNRSFRAPDSQVQGSLQQRQGRNLGTVMKEKEEELALFLEMRKREKERNSILLNSSVDFDHPLGSKPGSSPIFKLVPTRKYGTDDFLNSDGEKNDYDWLLTPPGTPLFPSLEMRSDGSPMGQIGTPKARPTSLKSRLANAQMEPAPRGNIPSRQPLSSFGSNSSSAGMHRPLSGSTGSAAPRLPTPTGRPTLPATTKPSRPSTPTSRATVSSSKLIVSSARPSTPPGRSSTPTSRPSVPATKSSRSATPTRRPSAPSTEPSSSIPPARSSSVTKPSSATLRNPVPTRGNSPTVKSRPRQPLEMPGFSLDAPPNLRTSMPERPVSASRGRPGAPSTLRSASGEGNSNSRPRRQSCSPTGLRGRCSSTSSCPNNGSLTSIAGRSHSNGSDSVSPVLIGSKMVDRVINVRRLAPPRQDDQQFTHNNLQGKSSSSPDSSGFGRTLSKKSLDMALRHMDIRRNIPGGLRPLMTNIPASSMYSVRSGPAKSRTVSVSDSPIATSSNASSEQSINHNTLCLDGSEVEDDNFGSEKGGRSSDPVSAGASCTGSPFIISMHQQW